jgi:hypothetical protein
VYRPYVSFQHRAGLGEEAYPLAIGVIERLEFDDVGVPDNPHDLQFTILEASVRWHDLIAYRMYLESLVLQDTLDGSIFSAGRELGLEDDPEGAIAHNLALSVLDLSLFTSQSILDFLSNDFCIEFVSSRATRVWAQAVGDAGGRVNIPPMRRPEKTPPGLVCDIVLF